jgi:hypothetical protein
MLFLDTGIRLDELVNLASGDAKNKHRRFGPLDNLGFRAKQRGQPTMTS